MPYVVQHIDHQHINPSVLSYCLLGNRKKIWLVKVLQQKLQKVNFWTGLNWHSFVKLDWSECVHILVCCTCTVCRCQQINFFVFFVII